MVSARIVVVMMSLCAGIMVAQDLRIVHAEYGHDRRYADVTEQVRRTTFRGRLDIVAANQTFGFDPAPAEVKTLRIEYTINGQPMRGEFPENTRVLLPQGAPPLGPLTTGGGYQGGPPRLRIVSAQYGAGDRVADVTEMLQRQVRDGQLITRVSPDALRTDPLPRRQKMLSVEYEYMERVYRTQAPDFSELRLPELNVMQGGGGSPGPYDMTTVARVGDLQIISAFYGSRNHMVDVGRAVTAYQSNGQVRMRVSNDTMGVDPDRGADKVLRVEYAYNGQRDSIQVPENNDLVLPRAGIGAVGVVQPPPTYNNGIVILSAGYGAGNRFVDVTRILQARQDPSGGLNINVTNDTMGGDPYRGPDKVLKLDYQFQGRTLHKEVREGDRLTLP